MALTKFISGGQTGGDRGALDAALVAGFARGGWCPANRAAEDGEIPARYPLTPLPAVNDAGTLLTQKLCVRERKPVILLDAVTMTKLRAADAIAQFVEEYDISVLNVAGPRLSSWPRGYTFALGVIGAVISNL